jgi:hypothetical protein
MPTGGIDRVSRANEHVFNGSGAIGCGKLRVA